MSVPKDDWKQWNPMAQDYYDKELNKYESGPGLQIQGEVDPNTKERDLKKTTYPYLVIKKKNRFVTENMLRSYFGDGLIYDLEYRVKSQVYFVYFYNFASIESAFTKIEQFPLNLDFCVGRPNAGRKLIAAAIENNETPSEAMPEAASQLPENKTEDKPEISLQNRTIPLSIIKNKLPEFFRPPLVTKDVYTSRNSLMAIYDVNRRYLNVRYEFGLAPFIQQTVEMDKFVYKFRSGRLLTTQKLDGDFWKNAQKCDDESKLASLAQKCVACQMYTDISCKYCDMPYCNAACFEEITELHKKSCKTQDSSALEGSLTPKNSIKAPKQEFSQLCLPASGCSVKITAFEQSNLVYIRSVEIHDDVAYCNVLTQVILKGQDSPQLAKLPRCGQIVLFKFDSEIVRAMVLNMDNPEAIYVVCVDFGNLEIVKLKDLYECKPELAALPRYAIPVLLKGVPRRYMRPTLMELLYELDQTFTYVLKYTTREFDYDKGMQRVVLIETEMNRSLNRLLKTLVTPVEPSVSEGGLTEEYLTFIPLEGKEVVIMDNSFLKFGFLHCTTLEFAYEIGKFEKDIQSYGESKKNINSYAPRKNDLCIIKHLEKWYRGVCLELVGDGFPSIYFLDYGTTAPIHVDNIRPYPHQFNFPVLTTECGIEGLSEELEDETVVKLEKFLQVGSIINCEAIVYDKELNNYMLRISNLSS